MAGQVAGKVVRRYRAMSHVEVRTLAKPGPRGPSSRGSGEEASPQRNPDERQITDSMR